MPYRDADSPPRARPSLQWITPLLITAIAVIIFVTILLARDPQSRASDAPTTDTSTTVTTVPTTSTSITTTTTPPATPADQLHLVQIGQYSSDEITPKSVDGSGTGLVFAQNMVYRRTVSVFNARNGALIKTIATEVNLHNYGLPGGTIQGAPVEGAFSPNKQYFYVSNYSMFGPRQGPEGEDTCTPSIAREVGDTPN